MNNGRLIDHSIGTIKKEWIQQEWKEEIKKYNVLGWMEKNGLRILEVSFIKLDTHTHTHTYSMDP